jgi:polar amino acid transport system substrate-binding protein
MTYKSMDIDGSPESLAGKIIGEQASTIHLAYANSHFGDAAEIRVYQTQDQANQDMFAGRVDAIQADSFAMVDFVGTDAGACCEVKGTVAKDEAILGRGVSAGVRKVDDVLREKLNMGTAAILSDGTHRRSLHGIFLQAFTANKAGGN